MGKRFAASAKAYAKNLGKHVGRVVARRETAKEALAAVSKDSKKLGHALRKKEPRAGRKQAMRLVKEARQAYNEKNYSYAEELLRRAVRWDTGSALAHTYLGHALYQQGRIREAVLAWQQAIEADPISDAASKARRKLQHVSTKGHALLGEMAERVRTDATRSP